MSHDKSPDFGSGIISQRTDIDFFSFEHHGGVVQLDIQPAEIGPNLDIIAEIYDDQGEQPQVDTIDLPPGPYDTGPAGERGDGKRGAELAMRQAELAPNFGIRQRNIEGLAETRGEAPEKAGDKPARAAPQKHRLHFSGSLSRGPVSLVPVADAAARATKPLGLHAGTPVLARWAPAGLRLVMNAIDIGILATGFTAINVETRELFAGV